MAGAEHLSNICEWGREIKTFGNHCSKRKVSYIGKRSEQHYFERILKEYTFDFRE